MPWTPPINRRENKDLLNDKRFYRLLSEQCNFIDPDTAFLWYIGLVTLIEDELKKNKIIRLPHLGDFALVEQRPRQGLVGRRQVIIGSRVVLKFYFKEKLRRYFNRQCLTRYSEPLLPKKIK